MSGKPNPPWVNAVSAILLLIMVISLALLVLTR